MLDEVKTALRVNTTAYDGELTSLIAAAELDLGIAGVEYDAADELILQAVTTYCKLHFGAVEDGRYDRLERSYAEQKAQLQMATGYTDWGTL